MAQSINVKPNNRRKSVGLGAICALLSFASTSNAAPSFEGPDSVPVYHPLCLPEARVYEEQGGAFDMDACAATWDQVPVKLMPNNGYFAKRPVTIDGESQGYVVYKPLGTLDGALELVLVHNKTDQPELAASVYVMGRLPDLSGFHRDFLTSIDELGKRCRGGIQSADLISEEHLEVVFNVNPHTMMSVLDGSDPDAESLKNDADNTRLDNRETSCSGTLTKRYNLLQGKEFFSEIKFADSITKLVPQNDHQACYDRLVKDFVAPPKSLSLDEFYTFASLYEAECSE